MSKFRATLVQLWTRVITYNEDESIYVNGEDNLYPSEMERVVMNSPTATRSANLFSKFMSGKGIEEENIIVNAKDSKRLTDILKEVTDDVSVQYGAWFHVGYGVNTDSENAEIKPIALTILDYVKSRKDKSDDDENKGKIWFGNYDTSEKKLFSAKKDEEKKWYYPFSKDENVILSQIRNDNKEALKKAKKDGKEMELSEMIESYRGQVYYMNLTPDFEYAVSVFDSVFNDCDTEYRIGVYANTNTREGFLGKLAVLVSGLSETASEKIKEDIANWLGSENSSSVYFLEIEDSENLDENFKILNVESQYNDDQFDKTEARIRRNILGASNNIPEGLLFPNESGGLFAGSGEAYLQMKYFYDQQVIYERAKIEETFRLLGFPITIIPIVTNEDLKPKEEL